MAKSRKETTVAAEIVLDKNGLPPRDIDGKPNPAYYRAAYAQVVDLTFAAMRSGEAIPWNADSVRKMIESEAESAGFDAKSIRDNRSDAEKIDDAVARLCEESSAVWELEDGVALALEKQMDNADRKGLDYMRGRTINQSPKVWRDRLARVRRLRERAKNQTSKTQEKVLKQASCLISHPSDEMLFPCALEAAWPLRVMVYCGRTNIADRLKGAPADAIYDISEHHCKAACDDWEAVNGVAYRAERGSSFRKIVRGAIDYKGIIIVFPFGHGKTDLGRFLEACAFVKNPKTQLALNHAAAEKAQETLAYLASLFSRGTPIGRRFVSLFGLETEQSNAKGFRLKMPDRLKSPSAWAAGVKSKVLGGNTSEQWWDDPVPMSDAEQETERKRTFQLLNGQWISRQRGDKWFTRITATLWHNDDAVSALIKLARDGKIKFRVSKQACGGPLSSPPFKPLWPNVMPASELKARYQQMRSPALYSAAYMSDPRSDSNRIIKKLRLYDPATEEHKQFMLSSIKYMSLDPAATRGERSDLAGCVYAGLGSVRITRMEDDSPVHATEQRLRLITVDSIPATQSDLVQHTVNLCAFQPVDYVMVETRSGFHGTADMFENYHGISAIRLDPKNKKKEERLRAAAPAIENANADVGVFAVVEFPGVRTGRIMEDGTPQLKLDPRFQSLSEEILDFGVCATDHCFPTGTLVATERGQVPIESVTASDRVWTRKGWKRVLRAWCTGYRHTITQFGITATPEHRIWTENRGWTELQNLEENDVLLALSGWPSPSNRSFRGSSTGDTQTPNIVPIACTSRADRTGDNGQDFCTSWSGSPSMGQFPMAMSSTTMTATRSTTNRPISSAYQQEITRGCTAPTEWIFSPDLSSLHTSQTCGPLAQRQTSSANGVSSTSWRIQPGRTNTAPSGAKLLRERPDGDSRTWSCAEQKAGRGTTWTRQENKQETWDLTVEDAHEFFADGVLVHNCLDALTQCVIYLMPELGIGTGGIVSKVVAQTNAMRGDPDLLKILAGYENRKASGKHTQDEHAWLKKNGWSMPEGGMPQG